MLTARSEDADKLLGFESGADDYITKPFNILELKARIRALLRRAGITASQPGSQSAHILEHGGVTLDTEKRSARKHGAAVDLTAREFDLAELFWRSPGRVFSRDSLLDLVLGLRLPGRRAHGRTCTSAACARSSRTTPPRPGSSSPSGASAYYLAE